jgi:hypothetical protein
MKTSNRKASSQGSLHTKEALYARVVDNVRRMSGKQIFESMVITGIYTPSGKLTKEYGGTAHAKR